MVAKEVLGQIIDQLYDDPAIGWALLGVSEVHFAPLEPDLSAETPIDIRLRQYETTMLNDLQLLADQVDELPLDRGRLRSEATATLVLLRELWRHFPELQTRTDA